jgi:hypothetical protein
MANKESGSDRMSPEISIVSTMYWARQFLTDFLPSPCKPYPASSVRISRYGPSFEHGVTILDLIFHVGPEVTAILGVARLKVTGESDAYSVPKIRRECINGIQCIRGFPGTETDKRGNDK